MDARRPSLEDLEVLALTAKDLADPWVVFFDHFAEDEAFLRESKPTRDALVERCVQDAVARLLGKPQARVDHVLLLSVKKQPVIHGTMIVEGRLVCVIGFARARTGLMAFPVRVGTASFARFSYEPIDGPADAWVSNPDVSDN